MEARPSCRELVELLADYLSNELPPRRLAAFDAHLAGCPSCVSYARTYSEAVRLAKLAATADGPAPSEVPAELVRAILAARGADL